MPDISMCTTIECRKSDRCYRSPNSGTTPTPYRQSWFSNLEKDTDEKPCRYFCSVFVSTRTNRGED